MKKGIKAEVICDSISPGNFRLTTFVLEFPRFILAEFNTHRMISKSVSSSRATFIKNYVETDEPVDIFDHLEEYDYDNLHSATIDLGLNILVWNKIKYQLDI